MQPPRSSSRGTIVFALVAVVALGSTVAATGLGGSAKRHLSDSRAKLRAECMEVGFGSDSPCVKRAPPVLTRSMLQSDELAAADAALKVGNRANASVHLASVLENATAMDHRSSIILSLLASSQIQEVAKRVDAEPALLDEPWLASTVRRVSLGSAAHPLKAERLETLARLSRAPAEMPLQSGGIAERRSAEAMDQLDVALRTMETASLAKDKSACEIAAASTSGLARAVTLGPGTCAYAAIIVGAGDRLADLRLRANARAHTRAQRTMR